MTTKGKTLVSILTGCIVTITLIFSVYTYMYIKWASTETEVLKSSNTRLAEQIQEINANSKPQDPANSVVAKRMQPLIAEATVNTLALAIFNARLKNDSLLQKAQQEAERRNHERNYKAFFLKYNLASQATSKLCEALLQRSVSNDDLKVAAENLELSLNDPVVIEQKVHNEREFIKAVLDVLGPYLHEQFTKYDRQIEVRQAVMRYAAGAAMWDMPLSLEQSDQLAEAVASTSPTYLSGGNVDNKEIDWDTVDEIAKQILTTDQFEYFQKANPFKGPVSRWSQDIDKAVDALIASRKQKGDDE